MLSFFALRPTRFQPLSTFARHFACFAAFSLAAPGAAYAAAPETSAPSAKTLRLVTHSSFALDKDLLKSFEQKHGVELKIVKAGDTGEMLNKLILTRSAPIADVVYGIDNANALKAEEAGILLPCTSARPTSVQLPTVLCPVDHGTVTLNYDKAWFAAHKLPLPKTLEDLLQPQYQKLLVLQSPATSSPGLAWFLATVQHFGPDKAVDYWRKLVANGHKVVHSWSQAYEKDFSKNGGQYPLVLSYGSSPAAEVFYSDGKFTTPPTDTLWLPGGYFLQTEGAGILKGGKEAALAQAFIAFLQSDAVQKDLQTQMWMYPAVEGVATVPALSLAPNAPAVLAPRASSALPLSRANVASWVKQWSKAMR